MRELAPDVRDAAIRIICAGLPGPQTCVAPHCKCYEENGKPIVRQLRALFQGTATPAEEALELLREMNDALCVPYRYQARVDKILDRVDAILEKAEPKLECISASDNCRRTNPDAINCCALYEYYAAKDPV